MLTLAEHGAQRHAAGSADVLQNIEGALAKSRRPSGWRPTPWLAALRPLLEAGRPIGALVAPRLGSAARPVRATLFDKSPATNWTLGWHQDRTIAVAARIDVPGFGPWTRKAGMIHVEPPFTLIESMLTLRIHLDPVPQ